MSTRTREACGHYGDTIEVPPYVCCGSLADIRERISDVRLPPKSGYAQCRRPSAKCQGRHCARAFVSNHSPGRTRKVSVPAASFAVRDQKFPVPTAGNFHTSLNFQRFVREERGCVLSEVPCIPPVIREFDGGDSFARVSQHSHPVARFGLSPDVYQSVGKKSGIAPPIWRSFSLAGRERARFSSTPPCPVYLYWAFWGSHFVRSRWCNDQRSVMMCVELRI